MKNNCICWANGDRCHGCAHYEGKAPNCAYRPPTIIGRFAFWLMGRCSFRNIFYNKAEAVGMPPPQEFKNKILVRKHQGAIL